ncbi:hypothetical protein LINPERPRIM_LOCUS28264 [Linum perenne]
MQRNRFRCQNHQHACQVPVGKSQEASQHCYRDLGPEKCRSVQASKEEREEQQSSKARTNCNLRILEQVDSSQ